MIINSTISEISDLLDEFNDSIKRTLQSKGISNTGEAERSLRVELGHTFARSVGIFYIEFLDKGRGKNPSKADPNFRKNIRKWLVTKHGITDIDELETATDRVVYFINKLGTLIYRDNKKGLEIDKKVLSLKSKLSEAVTRGAVTDIKRVLNKFTNKHK